MCIKGTEAEGRVSRSAERAVASRRDGVEEQRACLGGRVANIGFHGQQGREIDQSWAAKVGIEFRVSTSLIKDEVRLR